VTAVQIIEEIKRLPKEERTRIVEFLRRATEGDQLSPEELGKLAKRMVEVNNPEEADKLQGEIVRGFYGSSSGA